MYTSLNSKMNIIYLISHIFACRKHLTGYTFSWSKKFPIHRYDERTPVKSYLQRWNLAYIFTGSVWNENFRNVRRFLNWNIFVNYRDKECNCYIKVHFLEVQQFITVVLVIAQFAEHVDATIEAMKQREHIDENSFIDTVRLVFDGMRDIRRAVQMKEVSLFLCVVDVAGQFRRHRSSCLKPIYSQCTLSLPRENIQKP